MERSRIIPCLLLDGKRLVKTKQFTNPRYVGDPLNTIKIFSEKEVDEIILLDISVNRAQLAPSFDYIKQLADECFMPLCYGGGIRKIEDAARLIDLGVEKLAINATSLSDTKLIEQIAQRYGKQSVVAIMDVKISSGGDYRVWSFSAAQHTTHTPMSWAKLMQSVGAGEILVSSMDRDGTRKGYDYTLIEATASSVDIPVIAYGGANHFEDCARVVMETGASAAAASSIFIYKGKLDGILVSYPSTHDIERAFNS
jgi:imidazole glycerol-phosphate synthase subunit HisF